MGETGGAPGACGARSIMVVEDDDDVREALIPILEGEGLSVVAVANGREAIEQLRQGAPPCVILLDLMMPVMNGWQFRAEQLRDPDLASIPVIVLSAHPGVRETADTLRAAGYLQKPVEIDALVELVHRHC